MIKSVLIFFTIWMSCSLTAQVNVDSLRAVWNNENLTDTIRLQAVDEMCLKHYFMTNLDSALFYSEKMLELAIDRGLKKYQADAHHNMGIAHTNLGNTKEALKFNYLSLALREEIGDKRGIGRSLANIGSILQVMGKQIESLDHYKRALVYFEEIDDKGLIAHALNLLGNIHSGYGDFPTAVKYISRSMDVLEETDNFYFLSNTLLNLANVYLQFRDYKKAKEYAQKSKDISEKIDYKNGISFALLMLGDIYSLEGNYAESSKLGQEALLLAQESKNLGTEVTIYQMIGKNHMQEGDYAQALEFHNKALAKHESFDWNTKSLFSLSEIGKIHLLRKDPNEAVKWCKRSLDLAEEMDLVNIQVEASKCLYDSYKLLKNGNLALKYHEGFLTLSDSLQKNESIKQLQKMEFQKVMFQDSIAKAEEALLIQKKHDEEMRSKIQTRNISYGIGFLVLLLAGGLYSRLRYIKKSKAIIEKEKDRSNNLLLNILPADIAEELKIHGKAEARDFDLVSILFTDFKGFTEQSAKLSAAELVHEINHCFETFDNIVEKHGVEKIKTIGDAYMAAGGLPVPMDDSVKKTVLAALEMQSFIGQRKAEQDAIGKPAFEMRVGIHTGPVVAGIVGVKKFQYDIWGDTVNTASRIESNGAVGKVNISQKTYELLKNDTDFTFESRGKIAAKGKGEIEMHYVSRS